MERSAIFRHRFGGESGLAVVRALTALGGEAQRADIATTSMLQLSNTSGVLRRLETLGIVDKVRHGTWRLTGEDLDFLAEHWGANQVAKRQAIRHELDRAALGQYRLSRLAQLLPPDSLLHLQALNSVNACDLLTGEIFSIDDLWTDPTLIQRGVDQ